MLTNQTRYVLFDKSGKLYILETQLGHLYSCMAFMRQVIFGDQTCFQQRVSNSGRQFQELTSLGKHQRLLSRYPAVWSPHFSFHPALLLFLEQYRKHEIRHYPNSKPHDAVGSGKQAAEIFDDFISTMRAQVLASNVKKKIADWGSKSQKNRARMLEVERQIFNSHPRIAVVRLNLAYAASTFAVKEIDQFVVRAEWDKAKTLENYWSREDLSIVESFPGQTTFEEVQADRKRLFANMKGKPSLFKHQIGFIWKIDVIPNAGFRLCLALFFDAAQCKEQQALTHQIGAYWSNDITQSCGCYDIPGYKNSIRFPLSPIGRDDQLARSNLREMVLSDLCAVEQYVQVLPYRGANMYGSKFIPASPQKRRSAAQKVP